MCHQLCHQVGQGLLSLSPLSETLVSKPNYVPLDAARVFRFRNDTTTTDLFNGRIVWPAHLPVMKFGLCNRTNCLQFAYCQQWYGSCLSFSFFSSSFFFAPAVFFFPWWDCLNGVALCGMTTTLLIWIESLRRVLADHCDTLSKHDYRASCRFTCSDELLFQAKMKTKGPDSLAGAVVGHRQALTSPSDS